MNRRIRRPAAHAVNHYYFSGLKSCMCTLVSSCFQTLTAFKHRSPTGLKKPRWDLVQYVQAKQSESIALLKKNRSEARFPNFPLLETTFLDLHVYHLTSQEKYSPKGKEATRLWLLLLCGHLCSPPQRSGISTFCSNFCRSFALTPFTFLRIS